MGLTSVRLPDMSVPPSRQQYFEIVRVGLAVGSDDPLENRAAEDGEQAHAPAKPEQGEYDEHEGDVKVVEGCLTFAAEQELATLQTCVDSVAPWLRASRRG
jgi:hypothetical protein